MASFETIPSGVAHQATCSTRRPKRHPGSHIDRLPRLSDHRVSVWPVGLGHGQLRAGGLPRSLTRSGLPDAGVDGAGASAEETAIHVMPASSPTRRQATTAADET
jgi:hypothetical protein